ncbi:MAG: acyltransferase [Methylococcales bacterium]
MSILNRHPSKTKVNSTEKPFPREHLDFLDGIRGLASFYVVLHHIWLTAYPNFPYNANCQICRSSPPLTSWLSWGHLAVAVFIVVSGFSLTLGPQLRGDRLLNGFGTYIVRRAFRLIPPYWFALAISCIVIAFWTGSATGKIVNTKAVLIHALLLQDVIDSPKPNGAFWSIAIEWQIYFIFPLLLLIWRKAGGIAMVSITTIIVVSTYLIGSNVTNWLSKLIYLSPQFLALFAFGSAAAHVMVAKGGMASISWTSIGYILLVGTIFSLWWWPRAAIESTHFFWIDLLAGAATATLLAGFTQRPESIIARTLASRVPHWLGQSSYSLYLIHVPVLETLYFCVIVKLSDANNIRFIWLLLLVTPIAIFVSRLFWWAFERPFIRYRSIKELLAILQVTGKNDILVTNLAWLRFFIKKD